LKVRDIKSRAAALIFTNNNIIYSDQMVSRFGEFGPIYFAGVRRERFLLAAFQPLYVKIGPLAALWADIACRLCHAALCVKFPFVHIHLSALFSSRLFY
jgi:hypothetical protein